MSICSVRFPSVLKTEMTVHVEVGESTGIDDVKKEVFEIFWRRIQSHTERKEHGHPSQVILRDGNHKEITDTCRLRDLIAGTSTIEAVFSKHPKTPA